MQAVCRISDGLLLTPPPQGRGLPAITYPQHMWTRHSSVQSKTSNNPSHAPEVGNLERQSSIRSTLSSAEVYYLHFYRHSLPCLNAVIGETPFSVILGPRIKSVSQVSHRHSPVLASPYMYIMQVQRYK